MSTSPTVSATPDEKRGRGRPAKDVAASYPGHNDDLALLSVWVRKATKAQVLQRAGGPKKQGVFVDQCVWEHIAWHDGLQEGHRASYQEGQQAERDRILRVITPTPERDTAAK